jgi:hypothetical protein
MRGTGCRAGESPEVGAFGLPSDESRVIITTEGTDLPVGSTRGFRHRTTIRPRLTMRITRTHDVRFHAPAIG